ncbi:MAG: hypothetical protein WDZ35_08800 [Crocinitomicaceae bacterium]
MNTINTHNYEAFFLDYLEGNLNKDQEALLLAFIEKHPNLRTELEEMMGIEMSELTLKATTEQLDQKAPLKKLDEQLEQLMIASVEGELTADQEKDLQEEIRKNGLELHYRYYQNTQLKADVNEQFADKSLLRKEVVSETQIIALLENQLSETEKKALYKQVGTQEIDRVLKQYKNTVLRADLSVVYPDKSALKQRESRVVPLFFRYAAAAAILLLLGLFFYNPSNNSVNSTETITAEQQEKRQVNPKLPVALLQNKSSENQSEEVLSGQDSESTPFHPQNKISNEVAVNDRTEKAPTIKKDSIQKRPLLIEEDIDMNPPLVENPGVKDSIKKSPQELPLENDDIALVNDNGDGSVVVNSTSEQPFKIVTDAAGGLLKKEVFYQREKNTDSETYTAHHVKIGNFEFHRKKH